jgi:hypothetical protein
MASLRNEIGIRQRKEQEESKKRQKQHGNIGRNN